MGAEVPVAAAVDPTLALAQERLPFAGIDHTELIDTFVIEMGCQDRVIGRELGIRLMEHADIADASTTPLRWSKGENAGDQIGDLTLVDYVNFAAGHHPKAVGGILALLEVDPEQDREEYAALRDAMLERLNPAEA
jgi:hypothetical protein